METTNATTTTPTEPVPIKPTEPAPVAPAGETTTMANILPATLPPSAAPTNAVTDPIPITPAATTATTTTPATTTTTSTDSSTVSPTGTGAPIAGAIPVHSDAGDSSTTTSTTSKNATLASVSPKVWPYDHLLRAHVIKAIFTNEKEHKEVYCRITVGRNSSKTTARVLEGSETGAKEITWQEHFSIEYEDGAQDEYVIFEIFSKSMLKDHMLGSYKIRLAEIEGPAALPETSNQGMQESGETMNKEKKKSPEEKDELKEKVKEKTSEGMSSVTAAGEGLSTKEQIKRSVVGWADAKLMDVTLVDSKGASVGSLSLRLRREVELYGHLNVNLSSIDLSNPLTDGNTIQCLLKLKSQRAETPAVDGSAGEGGISHFNFCNFSADYEVDDKNNYSDLFIEVWKSAPGMTIEEISAKTPAKDKDNPSLVGEARMPLYDARESGVLPVPLFSPLHKHIGRVVLNVQFNRSEQKKHRAREVGEKIKEKIGYKDKSKKKEKIVKKE